MKIKGKWIVGAFIVAFILCFFGNSISPDTTKELILWNKMDEWNKVRKNSIVETDIMKILGSTKNEDKIKYEFTKQEIEQITTGGRVDKLSRYQAKEDVEMLFRILESSYGGYDMFGGKKAFEQAKSRIYLQLERWEEIDMNSFIDVILVELIFVKDYHFNIEGKRLQFQQKKYFKASIDKDIYQDNNGYYIMINKKKWYYNKQLEDYMVISIGSSGELVYKLAAYVSEYEKKDLPEEVTLHTKSIIKKTMTIPISWTVKDAFGNNVDIKTELVSEYKGIPVITINNLYDGDFTTIMDAVESIRDKSVLVLDLRSNHGGKLNLEQIWGYAISGRFLLNASMEYKTVNGLLSNMIVKKDDLNYDRSVIGHYEADQYTRMHKDMTFGWIPRVGNLFVLIDNETASYAEKLLFDLSLIENVVFVGTNSKGCLSVTGLRSNSPLYLPNSKVLLSFGDTGLISDPYFDTRGFCPDIYVAGEDVLEAIARCYEFYK